LVERERKVKRRIQFGAFFISDLSLSISVYWWLKKFQRCYVRLMTVDELIDLEVKAREMIQTLEAEIEEHQHDRPPEKLNGSEGRLSRQDTLLSHEMGKEAQRRRQQRLQELQEAVARMDAGTYGKCSACGAEIQYERLSVLPECLLCSDCAGKGNGSRGNSSQLSEDGAICR
jgi:DnaK suppressor protein